MRARLRFGRLAALALAGALAAVVVACGGSDGAATGADADAGADRGASGGAAAATSTSRPATTTTTAHAHSGSGGEAHQHGGTVTLPRALPVRADGLIDPDGVDLSGVEGVTPEQQARAEELLVRTIRTLPRWADVADAVADGFQSIGDSLTGEEHYLHWDWIEDDVVLDPEQPESLVYRVEPDGGRTLEAAMFMLPQEYTFDDLPDVGGPMTQWHIHDDLCFTEATPDLGPQVASLTSSGGACPSPLVKFHPNVMMHVWIRPNECGPFASLLGVGAGQVAPGAERSCVRDERELALNRWDRDRGGLTVESRLFVAGAYTEGETGGAGASTPVVSPVTGEHLADLPVASAADVDRAVASARAAFDEYRHTSTYERAAICHRVAALVEEHADELARLTTLEQGKPLEAEARGDVADAAELFAVSAEDAKRLYGSVIPSTERDKRILTTRQPVGVWAAITPWNFPLMIMAEFLAPALATGNAVVCKPPAHTPLACLRVGELLTEAGVPAGLVSIMPGDGALGEQLVTHPGVDAIGFVGSSSTAERIVRAAGLKRTIIEASGNGPVIVLDDADLERAAEAAAYGAYWNAGQVCCATERVIVDASVHDDFVRALDAASSAAVLGDPFDAATTLGPLNNEPTAAKMDAHVADAVARGAEVRRGGGRAVGFPTDLYYDFTVLDGVREDMLVAREESFGPVVPVLTAHGDDDALRIANADRLGLQAAVFTSSLRRAFRVSEGLRCGSVIVNDSTDYFENAMPFGGAGGTRTGWGRVGGLQQLADMTDVRCTIIGL